MQAARHRAPTEGLHRRRLRRAALRLSVTTGPLASEVARALRLTATGRADEQAGAWFTRIEAERGRLASDDREVAGGRSRGPMPVAEVARRASVPTGQGALLYHLARETGARSVLEMGTCVGISGAYLGAALTATGGGRLRSLEGHRDRAEVAREVWARLGLEDAEVLVGRFARTLDTALEDGPYDLVFVDGHHDRDATVEYFDRVRAVSGPGTLVVLDDIAWSDGMREAWRHITGSLRDSITCDLGRLGLVGLGPADVDRDAVNGGPTGR